MNPEEFVKLAAVYVFGVLSSIAVFRTRFARIDDRFDREKELRAMERKHDKEMLDVTLSALRRSIARTNKTVGRMERRQLFTQELTADIARKLGVSHRLIDMSTRDEDDKEPEHG